ncbi:PTS sugar transporter subunit IIB [Photobacterium satsumensis]|uniref:PTS sugar transporter subunit IIB n=1 Tax=Photobacterium satsumensis TaxID=2910239 RepID=UPI003D1006B6
MKKILLMCTAGMSTSMMVQKMQESATEQNLEVEIEAYGSERFNDLVPEYDIVLLGPQLKYMHNEFKSRAEPYGKIVEVINPMDYAVMNGQKVLSHALELIG